MSAVSIEPIGAKHEHLRRFGIKDKDGNPIKRFLRNPFLMNKNGVVFPDKEEKGVKELLGYMRNSSLRQDFLFEGDEITPNHKFRVVFIDEQAEKFNKEEDKRDDLLDKIRELSDAELALFGKVFAFSGTRDAIFKKFREYTRNKANLAIVEKLFTNPDKGIIEVIRLLVSEAEFSPNEAHLLSKGEGNTYKLNGEVIATGEEGAIGYLKANPNVFADLKKLALEKVTGKEQVKKGGKK